MAFFHLIALAHQNLVNAPRHFRGDAVLLRLNLALQCDWLRLIGLIKAIANPANNSDSGERH
ncbi:Uncharacterised protein [Vibrio cholerae]|nr:Uncharacterised protein [Vibrio cholerae]